MICKKCKNEIPDGSVFCPKCGKKISTQNNKDDDNNKLVTKRKKGFISGVCVTVGCC